MTLPTDFVWFALVAFISGYALGWEHRGRRTR